MGERYYTGFLLDGAEITDRDRAIVLGAANNTMQEVPIAMALSRMGPYLTGKVAIGRSEHHRPVLQRTTLDQITRRGGTRKINGTLETGATESPSGPVCRPCSPEPNMDYPNIDKDALPGSDDDNEANNANIPEELNEAFMEALAAEQQVFVTTGRTSHKAKEIRKLRGCYTKERKNMSTEDHAARLEHPMNPSTDNPASSADTNNAHGRSRDASGQSTTASASSSAVNGGPTHHASASYRGSSGHGNAAVITPTTTAARRNARCPRASSRGRGAAGRLCHSFRSHPRHLVRDPWLLWQQQQQECGIHPLWLRSWRRRFRECLGSNSCRWEEWSSARRTILSS